MLASILTWNEFQLFLEQLLLITQKKEGKSLYRFLVFTAIAGYTGLSTKEILNLKWLDVFRTIKYIPASCNNLNSKPVDKELEKILRYSLGVAYDLLTNGSDDALSRYKTIMNCFVVSNMTSNGSAPASNQWLNRELKKLFVEFGIMKECITTVSFLKTYKLHQVELYGQSRAGLIQLSKQFKNSSTSYLIKYIGKENRI